MYCVCSLNNIHTIISTFLVHSATLEPRCLSMRFCAQQKWNWARIWVIKQLSVCVQKCICIYITRKVNWDGLIHHTYANILNDYVYLPTRWSRKYCHYYCQWDHCVKIILITWISTAKQQQTINTTTISRIWRHVHISFIINGLITTSIFLLFSPRDFGNLAILSLYFCIFNTEIIIWSW